MVPACQPSAKHFHSSLFLGGPPCCSCSQVAISWNLAASGAAAGRCQHPFIVPRCHAFAHAIPSLSSICCRLTPSISCPMLFAMSDHSVPHAIRHLKPKLPRCRSGRLLGDDMWACLVFAIFDASLLHVFPSSALHLSVAFQNCLLALLQQFQFSLMLPAVLIHSQQCLAL